MKNNLIEYADKNQLELYKNFPSTHYLSNQNNVLHILAWGTFFKRNMHRFVIDYLKISLYEYQAIAIYMMGISNLICIIASRNDSKSFIVAVYAVARCLLYKGTKFRIGAATEKQAKLIVSEKIIDELCEWSPILKKEIESYSIRNNDIYVKFRNSSKVSVFVANENARGLRSNAICREETRQIKKKVEDSVISPFQTPRKPKYMFKSEYKNNKLLIEQPIDIYITSSWYDDGNWMWDIAKQSLNEMKKHNGGVMLAFDESVAIKHELKTVEQLIKERKKQDPATWKIEFLNLKLRDSVSSYFTYKMLVNRQVSKQVFYPYSTIDFKSGKKNKYAIPKLNNEIRVISNDIAFVAGSQNDNSVYSCIRAIPETITYDVDENVVEVKQGYKRLYPYIESNQKGDTTLQAIRIRQLYEDFSGDYIVLDTRNGGLQIAYSLQKVLYDEERGIEYPPLKVMNNDEYAKVCQDRNAKPCIYVINATQTLNSDIAIAFRKNLIENKIDFLVNYNTAKEEILLKNKEYTESLITDAEKQTYFELPFLETQLMINECAELQYEKMKQTGVIKIYEQGTNRKDRYTSCSYGSYFIDKLELDLLQKPKQYSGNISSLTSLARKPKLYYH
jgi:hypothetical protein